MRTLVLQPPGSSRTGLRRPGLPQKLAEVVEQWPIIGREDLYYGGTGYKNSQGLGVQLPLVGGFALCSLSPRQ